MTDGNTLRFVQDLALGGTSGVIAKTMYATLLRLPNEKIQIVVDTIRRSLAVHVP